MVFHLFMFFFFIIDTDNFVTYADIGLTICQFSSNSINLYHHVLIVGIFFLSSHLVSTSIT